MTDHDTDLQAPSAIPDAINLAVTLLARNAIQKGSPLQHQFEVPYGGWTYKVTVTTKIEGRAP